jgi:4-amino-4-deoxy-L-arabinose transferase-like glycosyltransferase
MKYILNKISKYPLPALLVFYFIFTLINLTLLPIFNDEAIYLDWGWLSLHVPGNTYLSLTDAKQPFMIWLFGISASVFSDPLFAGRFVSVLVGSLTLAGIYSLTGKMFDKKTAFLAGFMYAITPVFVFYNRQALMEAGVACAGIWAGSILLSLLHKPTIKRGVLFGVILGLGFFIKSSAFLFIVSGTILVLYYLFCERKKHLLFAFLTALGSIIVVDFFLLINPLFWQTLPSNSRYAYSIGELLQFPFIPWAEHLYGFFQVGFIFITPFVFLASLWGIYLLIRDGKKYHVGIIFYFLFALFLEIFTGKSQSQRYLVDFLPFLVIPAAYVLTNLRQASILKKVTVGVSLLIPLALSLILLFAPAFYIIQLSKVSSYSDTADVYGYTAGYGINGALSYIKAHSTAGKPTMVLFALWTGNPENALDVYSFKSPNLYPLRIDSSLIQNLNSYQCMTSSYPTFFVTRDGIRAGLDKYFSLEKTIPTHDPTYALKIYVPTKNCHGNTLSLSDAYQPLMEKELEIKSGL